MNLGESVLFSLLRCLLELHCLQLIHLSYIQRLGFMVHGAYTDH